MAEEAKDNFVNLTLCERPRKLSIEGKLLMKKPTAAKLQVELTGQENAKDGIILDIPTLSRRRNSIFIAPDMIKMSLGHHQEQSNFTLENRNGRNNNDDVEEVDKDSDSENGDTLQSKTSPEPVTIQALDFEDFLSIEQNFYGSVGNSSENLDETLETQCKRSKSSHERKLSLLEAGQCCICHLPGTKGDEYLAQGKNCFNCCLVQVVLVIINFPVCIATFFKWLLNLCTGMKISKPSSNNTSDDVSDNSDQRDTIEIKDFDYFWVPRDISSDQIDTYKGKIAPVIKQWHQHKKKSSLALIKSEFQLICVSNFTRRFEVLLGQLKREDLDRMKQFGLEMGKMAATSGYTDIVRLLINNMDADVKPTTQSDNFDIGGRSTLSVYRYNINIYVISFKLIPH